MYNQPDWRTDNWAGNKPTWWRDGSDVKFPRSMREAGIPHHFDAVEEEMSQAPNYFAIFLMGILFGGLVITDIAGFVEHIINLYQQCIGLLK